MAATLTAIRSDIWPDQPRWQTARDTAIATAGLGSSPKQRLVVDELFWRSRRDGYGLGDADSVAAGVARRHGVAISARTVERTWAALEHAGVILRVVGHYVANTHLRFGTAWYLHLVTGQKLSVRDFELPDRIAVKAHVFFPAVRRALAKAATAARAFSAARKTLLGVARGSRRSGVASQPDSSAASIPTTSASSTPTPLPRDAVVRLPDGTWGFADGPPIT